MMRSVEVAISPNLLSGCDTRHPRTRGRSTRTPRTEPIYQMPLLASRPWKIEC